MKLGELPEVGQPLDVGVFAGVTTSEGKHVAVVLLQEVAHCVTWDAAVQWAAEQGGMLPTRPIAAMLFANVKSLLRPGWHWTSDEYSASSAWDCYFNNGYQYYNHKSFEGSAVAIKLLELENETTTNQPST